jgi:hypothetical protein
MGKYKKKKATEGLLKKAARETLKEVSSRGEEI